MRASASGRCRKWPVKRAAVRAALMFCFEESVLCARRRNPLLSVGPDAPIVCPEETPHIFAGLLTLWFSRRVRPEGGAGGRAESHPAFLPEYLYPVGFSANYGPKGTGGNEGKRVPSGHNRRRRLATRSSGKQQAGRTAVRTAPIVCPEESPLARPQAQAFCRWGLTRRLRRGRRGCRPEGAVLSFEAKESTKESIAARRLREKGSYCPF